MIPKKSLSDQSISVVINTYNAEEHLEKVVKAVQDFDEVLVCDMESTDHTVEIARRLGCRVVTFPKANHKSAEPARTFAIQSATSPWVLVVDADEIVTPDLRLYLYRHIATPGCAEGLYIPRKNYFLHQLFGYPDYQLRFFIREGTEWPPYVHTFPTIKGRTEHLPKKCKELAFRPRLYPQRRVPEGGAGIHQCHPRCLLPLYHDSQNHRAKAESSHRLTRLSYQHQL